MAASTNNKLIQIKTNKLNSEYEGITLFAISDFLCSDEFKILQEQIFNSLNKLNEEKNNVLLIEKLRSSSTTTSLEGESSTSSIANIHTNIGSISKINDDNSAARDLFTESDNKYICKICGKELKKSNSIEDHIRTHTGEKPYKCKDCDKCFSQAVSLNLHMRVHNNGAIDNRCTICLIQFDTPTLLNNHMGTHLVLNRFQCSICYKIFGTSSKLRRHIPKHTGEKRYKCSKCDKCFTQSSSLNKHFRTTHSANPNETKMNC